MEVSPLTQQARPHAFQPKVAQLYDDLLRLDDEDLAESDGFWREFFLLKPDKVGLQQRLDSLSANDLLHLQHETQQLFVRAIGHIKNGKSPNDENALDTLTVFLGVIMTKRYTNPSADTISVVAGLDEVDTVFSDFANAVEISIRTSKSVEVREKAIDVALSLTSGAYQTSLVSYFTHRDLFPALMKYINDAEDSARVFKAFLLLGLLANYNKFESQNPYRARFEDFVSEGIIDRIVKGLRTSWATSRDRYVALQEDVAVGWTLSNTLSYIGLGILAPVKPTQPPQKSDGFKQDLAELPDSSAAILLGAYDFAMANRLFCSSLIFCPAETQNGETPFSAFLSFTSYMLHHAYRSSRASSYGLLNLVILRIIVEELALCKILCDPEKISFVRLCRQRQPFLPATPKPRPPAAAILDILVDTVNHNLRRHLDIQLYISTINLIHRLTSYLAFTRTRLMYHWSLLWQTLLSFLRFLTTYAPSLTVQDPDLSSLIKPLLATLALAVISGESFLPDAAAYDDLFYKLVETGEYLQRFKTAFASHLAPRTDTAVPQKAPVNSNKSPTAPIDVLIQVSAHYQELVEAERSKGRMGNNPSPREVSKIIRQGYEALDLPVMEGLDLWDRFREGNERGMLKRVARVAVDDTKRLLRSTV